MADDIVRFDDLWLIDDLPAYTPLGQRLDAELELKCFAPIGADGDDRRAGIILFNLYVQACYFIDTLSVTNRPWPLKIIPFLTFGGLLGVLLFILSVLIYLMSDCCYSSLFEIGLAPFGIALAIGSAVAMAAMLFLSAKLFPPRTFATVDVPPELMEALVEQHRQFTEVKQAIEASGKGPATLGEATSADLAGRGVGQIVSAILPAGLGEVAGALASDTLAGRSTEDRVAALRMEAKLAQSALVLSHHRQHSGRGSGAMADDIFRGMPVVTLQQLQRWTEHGFERHRADDGRNREDRP